MSNYEPELGQMCFGNRWEIYDVPKEVGEMLYELSEKLSDNINDMPGYGTEYKNDVFEIRRYYWGDCTCGFEEEEYEWCETHDHKEDCFHKKYEKYEAELEAQGIEPYGEEWEKLMDKFAKENGYTGWQGAAFYCDCGFEEEYERWRKTHDHKPDCPIVLPNFYYKPTGLAIYWYKYIGRGMSANQKIDPIEFRKIIDHCIKSAEEDIKKASEAKRKQKAELKRWRNEKKARGYICPECINFFGENGEGKVVCAAKIKENEREVLSGITVIEMTPTVCDYKTKCEDYLCFR